MPASDNPPAGGPASERKPGPRVVLRHDASLQWAVTLLIIAIAVITVRPVGVSGRGLAVVALLVVNSVALLARHLPPAFPRRAALVWLTAGAVASAGLLEVSNSGSGYLFAYFLVGHAGYRLALKPALAVAALSSLLCGAVFYFYVGPDHQVLTWTFGLSTGIPVVAGILGRSRQQAAEARLQAAESAERAEARTAVLTERGRIARDVHDVLAHSLAGINMHLELADALMDTGDLEKVRAAHNKAQSLVRESLKQAQWTVHALREDSLPLLESLTAMIESSGHREVLTVTGAVRELPAQVTQNVLRIAQEALTNAARHAPGAEIAVELAFDAASTSLAVRNGPATGEATAGVGSGMGLIGMRERVALLGGTLTAGPLTGGPDRGGWQVEAVIRG